MESIYLGEFNDREDILYYFDIVDKDLKNVNILFAVYEVEDCLDGSAFILFEKDGKLYEVNGISDSYNGLEGQWEPEEITIEDIKYRLKEGELGIGDGGDIFNKKLLKYIKENWLQLRTDRQFVLDHL